MIGSGVGAAVDRDRLLHRVVIGAVFLMQRPVMRGLRIIADLGIHQPQVVVRGQVLRIGIQRPEQGPDGLLQKRLTGLAAGLAAFQPGALEQRPAQHVGYTDIFREVEAALSRILETGVDNGLK